EAVIPLIDMATVATEPFPAYDLKNIQEYYVHHGYKADQAMRQALAAVKTERDKSVVTGVIRQIYKPWVEQLTQKFQEVAAQDATPFRGKPAPGDDQEFILFVDALRYELGMEFLDRLANAGYKVSISAEWSALPSLTPTAKPAVSPLSYIVSESSACHEFRPQLLSGKDLQTAAFRSALAERDFVFISSAADIQPGRRHWQEIGDIDAKGHAEQAGMVRRMDELFEQLLETISSAFEQGIKQIQIVTDHGWLLLPGGLPKEELNKSLTETRWGRCALIKEGAKTDLLHLPWRWNPAIYIAYAPGISFFKRNEEYAHGGISVQECLTPLLHIYNPQG
ncbi:MAG: BREX-1 system phosphatase PglZ type B, partial [Saprospiraceae bacterium]